MGPLL